LFSEIVQILASGTADDSFPKDDWMVQMVPALRDIHYGKDLVTVLSGKRNHLTLWLSPNYGCIE
jgi:hypothetical protein